MIVSYFKCNRDGGDGNTLQWSKRGRPKDCKKLSRRMSDITKKKISEKCKKFSLCKLCSKQCRGFRGLVDHMHRDHEDYKPWRCHICHERTTFVKTLYRHLNQKHDTKSSPCHVCGKKFSRAQSMLLHVSQVRRLAYIYNWSIVDYIMNVLFSMKLIPFL